MFLRRLIIAGILSLFAASVGTAQVAQGPRSSNQDPASLQLHGGWVEPDGTRIAGLRMELAPGWKTYWRVPGEAGIPPYFDWTGSENIAKVDIEWPAPMVFVTYGIQNVGYKDRLVMPLRITPEDPTAPMRIQLSIFYGLCQDVCIPARDDMVLNVAPDARPDGAVFVRNARMRVPLRDVSDHIAATSCEITGAGETRQFTSRITLSDAPDIAPTVIPEGPDGITFGAIKSRVEGSDVISTGPAYTAEGEWIDRGALSLTVLQTNGPALHIAACAAKG